jgi:ADP-heptose:LPS heptosyltransferase
MPTEKIPSLKEILFCTGNAKTKLLKIFDYFFGSLLGLVINPPQPKKPEIQPDTIKRILIVRPGGIGDAVLLIPFIKELRSAFPHAEMDILAERRNREIFSLAKDIINEIFIYDNSGLIGLYKKLQKKDYDLIFDTEQWHHLTAIFSYLICKKTRVGFGTNPRRSKFYNVLVPYSHGDYEMQSFLNLLSTGLPSRKISQLVLPFINPPSEQISWAKDLLKGKDKLVAICLSASISQRLWSTDNFRGLIKYLIVGGYQVLLLGGKKEYCLSLKVSEGVDKREDIVNLAGKTTLSQLVAILSLCRFYIGVDSGILHLAYALDIPTISLFGPGIKEKWAPPGEKHIAVGKDLPCSPCTLFGYTPNCRHVQCMKSINLADVIAAVKNLESLK